MKFLKWTIQLLQIEQVGPWKYEELARYNSERARGIVHTPEWDAEMAEIQKQFNQERYG